MKSSSLKWTFFFICLFIINQLFSQAPAAFNYQAVIRNSDGSVLQNTPITLNVTIHEGSAGGTIVYSESHSLTTNSYGLITTQIGSGTAISGSMSSVNWGSNSHYLSVSMNDGTNTVDMGTTQILSVPYALEANHAATTDAFTLTSPNGTVFTLSVDNDGNLLATSLSASISSTNITCYGSSDGTITVSNASGGSGNYEYSNNGGSSWQTSATFSGLPVASYHVMIRDRDNTSNSKTLNSSLSLTQPIQLSASVSSIQNTCNGGSDGTITISSPLGGSGSYEYSNDGGTNWQSSGSFTGLIADTYSVMLRDANHTGCEVTLNGNLEITEPVVLSASLTSTNLSGNGSGDGTITISSPSGGSGSYEYSIDGGTSWQSSGSFSGLSATTYNVMLRDVSHTDCEITLNGSLTLTEPGVLSATISSTNITCNGQSDGTITLSNPSGGYGNYEYSINGGSSWQSSAGFSGLPPSAYNVMIRDSDHPENQETLNGSLSLTQPDVLSASVSSTDVTCNGGSDGTITISSPLGGSGSYEYSINGGTNWQSSGSYTGLSATTCNVMIRDANHTGCEITLDGSLTISQLGVLSANVSSTNLTANGSGDGTITISSPNGGSSDYEYSINGGSSWQSSGSYTNLNAGTYNVMIRDANHTGCEVTLNGSLELTEPSGTGLPTEGLVAYYPFNGNANDESGNGLNGTVTGAIATTDRNSIENSALLFDGSDDKVEIPDNDLLDIDAFSLSCWFLQSNTSEDYIITKGNNSTYNGPFRIYKTDVLWVDTWSSVRVYQSTENITITWHHATLTYDGSVQKLYFDGSLIDTDSQPGPLKTNNDNLIIGDWNGKSGVNFQGKIDEVRLYNRALTSSEIQNLYSEGVTATTPTVTTTSPTTSITSTTATVGGNVTSDGGATITDRGIYYSTNSGFADGEGTQVAAETAATGAFTVNITGLTASTPYYYRAYAKNTEGEGYGVIKVFNTLELSVPEVSTIKHFNLKTSTVKLGGTIIDTNGSIVTQTGIKYSTNSDFESEFNIASEETEIGDYYLELTNLPSSSTIYYKAYAINSEGIGYGEVMNFSTNGSTNTVQDIDGNIYQTVSIGTQVWISENLKVTKYNDGTSITKITSPSNWDSQVTGAYCWYDNDSVGNGAIYGALYNWNCVETQKICPVGFSVPNKSEIEILISFLGGAENAGGKLKEYGTRHWYLPPFFTENIGASDDFGFTFRPGGYVSTGMGFNSLNNLGYIWSSELVNNFNNYAYRYLMKVDSSAIIEGNSLISTGFSIRCLKE